MRTPRPCLRCGQPLPDGCVDTRKYCDVCQKERKKELARERKKKYDQRQKSVEDEKQEIADRNYCRPCRYYGSENYGRNLCDYYMRTGERRGCHYGVGCKKRIVEDAKEKGA